MVKLSDKNKFLSILGILFISLILSHTPLSAQESDDLFLLPEGAGILLLGGSLSDSLAGSPLITEFLGTLPGGDGKILVVAFGFSSAEDAGFEIEKIAEHLPLISDSVVLTEASSQPLNIGGGYVGIILIGEDQSPANLDLLSPIRRVWLSGMPVLALNTGSAILGSSYSSANNPMDDNITIGQDQSSRKEGEVIPGLNFLNLAIEPQILSEPHWLRFITLANSRPNLVSVGIPNNTFLKLTHQGASVIGESDIFVLRLENAPSSLESVNSAPTRNRHIDVFGPGTNIPPMLLSLPSTENQQPTSTPILATESPEDSQEKPTRTPKPTATPPTIPPPQNFSQTNLMILFVVLAVIVVIIGVWLNRERR